MAKRVKIVFVSNPTGIQRIQLQVAYGSYSYMIEAIVGLSPIDIEATKELTAANLYDYYIGLTLPAWLDAITTISIVSNIIYFDFAVINNSSLSFPVLDSTQSSMTIDEVIPDPVVPPDPGNYKVGLVRSTLSLRVIPNLSYDSATLDLYNWSGSILDVPAATSYSLSKSVVQLGQPVINFDINELAKTNIAPTISNYTLSGVQPIPFNQSCWSYYVANCYAGNDLVYTATGIYLCLYGYGYFQDLYNPQPTSSVLIDGNTHTHLRGYDNRLHFLTRDLSTLTINGTPVAVAFDENFNYDNAMSVNLNDYDASDNTLILVFTYAEETRTVIYTVKNECKYEVMNCVFINKYGLPQSLFFTKAQKRSDEIESSEYRGLISSFGVYNSTSHMYKSFNSNGRSKVSCNTDYLNESENATFKQLMLSESIWLVENGVINPVTIDKKSMEYKTALVDKLIQYSIDFKYSFDIINQC